MTGAKTQTAEINSGRSLKGALRREALIDECMKVLATEGVVGLSYEILAQRLKLTRAHVKYYFNSKEDLLNACFLQIAEAAQNITIATLQSRHTWQDRLHGVADSAFLWVKKHPEHVPILFLYYHYCAINPALANTHAHVRAEGRKRIEQILATGPSQPAKPSVAARHALSIQLYITGQIMEAASTGRTKDLRPFHQATTTFIQMIIEELER